MHKFWLAPAFLFLANCTTPAYLVRQTAEPKGGEIEMVSPDGVSFVDETLKASSLMLQVCGGDVPQVISTEYRSVPFYSALQENTSYQKRGYVTFSCGLAATPGSALAGGSRPSSGRAPASLPGAPAPLSPTGHASAN